MRKDRGSLEGGAMLFFCLISTFIYKRYYLKVCVLFIYSLIYTYRFASTFLGSIFFISSFL